MYDCDVENKYARYSYFHVEGSSVNYKLHFSGYSGTAGDGFNVFTTMNGMPFSTRDSDNDLQSPKTVQKSMEVVDGGTGIA